MRIRSSYRREGFETDGSGALTKSDISQLEGRRELNNRYGVYICLGDGVFDVEDGVFLLIPNLSEIEISNTVVSIPVSDETLAYLHGNDVLIRGEFDSYGEKFARQYGLRFIHSDLQLGTAGDYFKEGVDIITLRLRYYDAPEIHQDCRCQGISASSMGGGECSFYLPEDFYSTMTQEDVAGQCWGTCYGKIMNNEKFRVFLSKAKQKKGFRFNFGGKE